MEMALKVLNIIKQKIIVTFGMPYSDLKKEHRDLFIKMKKENLDNFEKIIQRIEQAYLVSERKLRILLGTSIFSYF